MNAAMTEDEMVRALKRQFPVDHETAVRMARTAKPAVGLEQAYGIAGPAPVITTKHTSVVITERRYRLALHSRLGNSLRLVIDGPPRTKKNGRSGAFFGIGGGKAYRALRDSVVEELEPLRAAYGAPILPDQPYNCRAVFYVDKRGEQADFNGLNQGLHDALENAGVVSDDWHFRQCDGTRIVFGDERPRVEVHITPIPQGT